MTEQNTTEQGTAEQDTTTEQGTTTEAHGGQQPRGNTLLQGARNTWRGLTSMRTALILLFLLALGALPGALLPQRSLNQSKVDTYLATHGWWGRFLDTLQFFDVYSSVWFSAVYVLLFVSLVGCLAPRSFSYVTQLRARPVLTPRNLNRMPHHDASTSESTVDDVIEHARTTLRGWRTEIRDEAGGARSVSAEKGYLRETGNLIFHFAMLGLIVAFALGKMFSYSGQVIVLANGSEFCNSGVYNYDSFTPGLRVDGTELAPFCVRINDFTAQYTNRGQPEQYHSNIDYSAGADLARNAWHPYPLEVNSPLRVAGDRVYLAGNGYAPVFTVTFPNGQQRTKTTQWRPEDPTTMLSSGATKFDPPGITDPAKQRRNQLAVTGLFAPTANFVGDEHGNGQGTLLNSSFPAPENPAVAVDIYRGDLGIGNGRGQSIFAIDQQQVSSGLLKRVARVNLKLGQQTTLDDGTKIRFDRAQRWVSLQVAHDPTQLWVLVFALATLFGLATSLIIKRRRLWVRASPAADGSTVVQVAGLARTDQAGYGEEFATLSTKLLGKDI